MSIAHVVAPPGNHLVFLWPASAVTACGVVLALINRRRTWRRLWATLAAVGFTALVVVYALEPSYAAPPPFAIRLIAAASPGDIAAGVCPVTSDGNKPILPGNDRLFDIYVDGKVAAEGAASRFLILAAPGTHTIYAELVQGDHVAFLPAETTPVVSVTVTPGPGTALAAVAC